EHEADMVAAPGGQLACTELIDTLVFDIDLTTGGGIQSADEVEQCGLAGAGRAHQRDEVAAGDIQIDTVQHLNFFRAALVGLGDVAEGDEGAHGCSSAVTCWVLDAWVESGARGVS